MLIFRQYLFYILIQVSLTVVCAHFLAEKATHDTISIAITKHHRLIALIWLSVL